jgi:hypothetical protein
MRWRSKILLVQTWLARGLCGSRQRSSAGPQQSADGRFLSDLSLAHGAVAFDIVRLGPCGGKVSRSFVF